MRNDPELLPVLLRRISGWIKTKYEENCEDKRARDRLLLALLIPIALIALLHALGSAGFISIAHRDLLPEPLALYWVTFGLFLRGNRPRGADLAAYLLSAAAVCLHSVQGNSRAVLNLGALLTLSAPVLLLRTLHRDIGDAKYMIGVFFLPAIYTATGTTGLFYFGKNADFSLAGALFAAALLAAGGKRLFSALNGFPKAISGLIVLVAAVFACALTEYSLNALNYALDPSAPQIETALVDARWIDESDQPDRYHVRFNCGGRSVIVSSDRAADLYSRAEEGSQIEIALHAGALGREYFVICPE